MSNEETEPAQSVEESNESSEKVQPTGWRVAKVGSQYVQIAENLEIPADVTYITREGVEERKLEDIAIVYGLVARVSPKKFKNKQLAMESMDYQVGKLQVLNSFEVKQEAPVEPKTAVEGEGEAEVDPRPKAYIVQEKERAARVRPSIRLLTPADPAKCMESLAPQAKMLVSILTDAALERENVLFTTQQLTELMNTEESVARLKTRQEGVRIMMYYRRDLIESGLIAEVKE